MATTTHEAPTRPARGRPRDEHRRKAVLQATLDLAAEAGLDGLSFESIASRSGVGRPMLYRWWPNKAAILIEALLDVTTSAAPYPDTGNIEDDLRIQAISYARLLTGRHGNAYRAVFGEAQRDSQTATLLFEKLIGPRRLLTKSILQRGVEQGQLRESIDIEAAIDLIYAPIIYRLLLGHAPLKAKDIKAIVALAIHGLRPTAS
jgi:AcrR family transcriptional regulator